MTLWKRWWKLGSEDEPTDEAPEPIREDIEGLKPRHARYLSAYAAVLARIAYADREATEDEAALMVRILQEVDDVPEGDAQLVVAIALGGARQLGEDEGREAALTLGKVATRAQRLGLLRCLYAVAAAHRGVSAEESEKIAEISRELALSADDLATCRLPR
jgi:tellurite resistance protein